MTTMVMLLSMLLYSLSDGLETAQVSQEKAASESSEAKRKRFAAHREILLARGLPIEPNDLLNGPLPRDEAERLRAFLKSLGNLNHRSERLAGVYLADTLYLSADLEGDDDITIVANRIAFKGDQVTLTARGRDVNLFVARISHLTQTPRDRKPQRFTLITDGSPAIAR